MASEKVFASIITIGDELLIGQVIDTNSAWLAQELNKFGIWVKRRVAVGDAWQDIWNALDEESHHSSVVIITGGLGPTADDITKPLLCKYFGGQMIVNEEALANVKAIFTKYLNRPLLESNLRQAEVPDVCTVLQNPCGTAPGMLFKKNGKVYISLPGVPVEMKAIMKTHVLSRLSSWFTLPCVVHKTLLTAGIGESFLSERIKTFEAALPPFIKLAYLPNFGLVKLRLTATGADEQEITQEINIQFQHLTKLVSDVMVIDEDKKLEEAIGQLLKNNGLTLVTAESCTGGYVAHLITSLPGSSDFYSGSVVSYSNALKKSLLGVPEEVLAKNGAVSEPVVLAMASGAKERLGADYALAISGIMGPAGGSLEKPVGTVWIAIAGKKGVVAKKFHARFDRQKNIEVTSINALIFLRQTILSDFEK